MDNARGRHRRQRLSATSRIRNLGSESLVRNSAFLVVNLVFGAVCGYGSLSLLTRLYTVQAVGLSSTATSTTALIIFIMGFGVNYSLPRFLATSTHRTALINTVLTVTMFAALLAGGIFLALPIAEKLYTLGGLAFVGFFLADTCVGAGSTQLETILVADRSSRKVALANALPNVIKLAAPITFIALGMFGAYMARIVGDFIGFVMLVLVLARQGHRFRPAASRVATKELRRFSFAMYFANLIGSLPLMLLPIIVLTRFGSEQSAYWSIAITTASLLYQLPGAVAQALLPEVARRPEDRGHLLKRSAILIGAIMTPVLTIAYVGAPLGLALFGHRYVVESLEPLRWLIIAGFITIMNYVSGAVLFLAKKTLIIAAINMLDAVIVITMALTWATDARGIAISWAAGDLANTALFGLFAILAVRQVRGRWEDLGSPQFKPRPSDTDAIGRSQREALDVLLRLAEAQIIVRTSGTRTFSIARPNQSRDTEYISQHIRISESVRQEDGTSTAKPGAS